VIRYHKDLLLTHKEIEGKTVLLIHAFSGCMFKCYDCFNYETMVTSKQLEDLDIEALIAQIKLHSEMIDLLVISGGEYLHAKKEALIFDLTRIKQETQKDIIVYTTGYYTEKVIMLSELGLVDGYHIDMKLPYHLIDEGDEMIVKKTVGKSLSKNEIHQLLTSINYVCQNDKGLSQVRSVRYPYLDKSAFVESQRYIEQLNRIYGKNTPYKVNRFIHLV